jgi:4-amino-4-deoxy-L-arabinose transferase-like glycosyltransferase
VNKLNVVTERKYQHRILLVILALSVLARVGVALYYGNVVDAPALLTDQRSYHWLGVRLLEGAGFSFPRAWYPFTPAGTPTAHWSFLYSLIVAGVYGIFGAYPLAMRLFQAVAGGILLPYMVYRLTKALFSPSPAHPLTPSPFPALPLIAAACTAVYAFFILYAATIMTETFFMVAVLWSLERALALAASFHEGQKPAWSAALGLGVSLGLATLLRQAILPWIPVLFAWLLIHAWVASRKSRVHERKNVHTFTRSHVHTLLLSGAILLMFILPWTYRNYRAYGEFLLLNSNSGYAMYSAQHPMHGTNFIEHGAAPLPEELRGQGLNEAQWDGELMRRGIGFVLAEPGRYLRLSLSRVADYFEFWPTETTLLHNLGRLLSFTLYLPFMLYGLYLAGRARLGSTEYGIRDTQYALRSMILVPTGLLYAFMLFYSTLHILTWAMPRYRLPVDAAAMPFAALAFERVLGWVRAKV